MKRIVLGAAAAAGSALCIASSAFGGFTQDIEVNDNFFDPRIPPVVPVQTTSPEMSWTEQNTQDHHNVRQDHGLFLSGPPVPDLTFVTDISAGRYHYYCGLHGYPTGGMDGVVRIRPTAFAGDGDSAQIFWADANAEAKHRFAVQFRKQGNRRWKSWKRATAATQGVFGQSDRPINANPNASYQVRARTFVKGQRGRHSGWSPVETFTVELPDP